MFLMILLRDAVLGSVYTMLYKCQTTDWNENLV